MKQPQEEQWLAAYESLKAEQKVIIKNNELLRDFIVKNTVDNEKYTVEMIIKIWDDRGHTPIVALHRELAEKIDEETNVRR